MSETVIERDGLRVRIDSDTYPEPPYNDGGTPLLRVSSSRYGEAPEQVTEITPYVLPDEIIKAARHFLFDLGDEAKFERYLRIYHGTTSIKWWGDSRATDYNYVTFDTAAWREELGLTDQYLTDHAELFKSDIANMDEWIAYVTGEVYGVVIEELVTWVRFHGDGVTVFDTRQEWELVDSCYGFYGYEYAVESAKEQFDNYAPVTASA